MRWSSKAGDPDVSVNLADRDQMLTVLAERFQARQGFALATLNLDHVVKLRRQPDFKKAYLAHTYVTADGNPIVWLSKLAGQEVSLIPGSELIEPVIELAVRHHVSVALFGATQESLDAAAQAITANFPGVKVAAALAPPMGFDPTGAQADDYIEQLKASGAGLCFLALGAPKQEMFAAYAHAKIGGMGFVSIGAGLDFISKAQTRAPEIVRKFALEWLWRLLQNPSRLAARYGACFAVLPSLLVRAVQARRGDVS